MSEPIEAKNHPLTTLRAESVPAFRMAQLLLVLSTSADHEKVLNLEQLSVIEFLSANPFLVLPPDSPVSERLRLQGFGRHSINYASPSQRFVSRRERVATDMAQLIAFGLVRLFIRNEQRVFTITDLGEQSANTLFSVYADAYRLSTKTVIPLITKLSPSSMREHLEKWLRVDPVLFDLFDSPSLGGFQIGTADPLIPDLLF